MKRANPYTYVRTPYKYKRIRYTVPGTSGLQLRNFRLAPPQRTYNSMVPLRTGGYTPNRTERKVNDINAAVYQVNTTGSLTLLANPALGSDFNNRIGRKITLSSFYIRGYIQSQKAGAPASSTPTPTQQARLIVFCDLQPNGAVPAVADLLVESNSMSQLNLNNRDRFKIYYDKEFIFDPFIYNTTATQAVASASRQAYNVKRFKRIKLETVFQANGGTIADISSGALYMLWIGSTATGVDDINAVVSTRVRYLDK